MHGCACIYAQLCIEGVTLPVWIVVCSHPVNTELQKLDVRLLGGRVFFEKGRTMFIF